LTAADLVTGGKGPTVRPPVVETRAVAGGGTRAAGTGQRAGLQVEVIRGERSETVSY
jgi:pilus assembly protein CpaB